MLSAPLPEVGSPDRTLLVIEPDPDNCAIAVTVLEAAGFRVEEAASPLFGLRRAGEIGPALIISELFERTQDGWWILEKLRADPRTHRVPIVAFSAHATPEDEAAALRSGASRFLPKPLPPIDLLHVVSELLSEENA